ncbi:PREDICTED: probable ubiquitin-like-specific protease 2B isoform X1 [Lupinus angustifolius]|uniref:probable ubiquitin-like-specific protease 2B isoform X1 n=1 Tax=Lupinus angustifolius TaxID=3871 RepID=UPI00092EE96A|nr:PREDICTED: probable ubiquitin-like-specific protease 2B isoform X1 [Lupinus angustifolius]
MNESPRRDLAVFDFKAEDEIDDQNQFSKFKNPIHSPSDPDFLQHDTQVDIFGVKNVASTPCVDVDAVDGNFNLEKGGSEPPLDTTEAIFHNKEENPEVEAAKQSYSINHENHCHIKIGIHKYNEPEMENTSGGVSSPETSQIDPSGSLSNNESVDADSEADDFMFESARRSPPSYIAENGVFNVSLNSYGLNGICSFDMDDANTEVVLHPDYVIYQDNYYMGPKLTFSDCCVKINVSTSCIKQGSLDLEWAVDDLIDIKCQLFQSSGTVIMKLHVISSNASQSTGLSGTSGIEELEVAVVDSNWSLKHTQITSLNMKYLAIWNIVPNTDIEGNENDSDEPRCYFPNFDEPFDEVVFPKGDPDAVSLSKRDVDLLQPDTFINDTIIDFYIQYLKSQIQADEKPRFHFFNSFFFRKLADMDKNPSSASDGKAAFLRVRKWTRKVNLFEKDYIFIPVNFNLHWSLIVICHPGEAVNFKDKELDKPLKVPCILHMDSIKGSHSGLKNLLQRYLWEEWKERHKDALEENLSSRFLHMRFLPLVLPQQDNSFDCGLFLLHYLELFLAEAPSDFNPFKLTKFSNFLNVDWFPPAEAYLKRTLIQRLIFELVENHGSHESSSSDCSNDNHIYVENNENGTSMRLPEINKESSSRAGKGIEMTLLSSTSSLDPQSFNNQGLVLKEFFAPGATAETLLGQCQSYDQRSSDYHFNGSIFPMEEGTGLGEQLLYLDVDPNIQQVAGITPQTCSLPYLPKDCGDETFYTTEISPRAEHDVAESSTDTSSGASDDSEEIEFIENFAVGNEAQPSNEAEQGEKTCSPVENPKHITDMSVSDGSNLVLTSITGISQDIMTKSDDNNNNGDLQSSPQEIPTVPLHHVSDAVDDKVTCDDGKTINDVAPDVYDEQAAKRRKLMPPECEDKGILTESNL